MKYAIAILIVALCGCEVSYRHGTVDFPVIPISSSTIEVHYSTGTNVDLLRFARTEDLIRLGRRGRRI